MSDEDANKAVKLDIPATAKLETVPTAKLDAPQDTAINHDIVLGNSAPAPKPQKLAKAKDDEDEVPAATLVEKTVDIAPSAGMPTPGGDDAPAATASK